MTILQVKFFLAICEFGGFSAAADEMYISQSSLSKQIKSLETELGLPLFLRSNNKVSLTPGGEMFLTYARIFVNTYSDMVAHLSGLSKDIVTENIYFGTLPLLQDYHIAKQLAVFQENMHNIQINITEASQQELLHLLLAKKINLSILRLNYLNTDQFDFAPIHEDRFTLVCSIKHAETLGKGPLSLRKLHDYPFVILGCESDIYQLCMDQFAKADFSPNITNMTSRHLHLLNMVDEGIGITILPKIMMNRRIFPNLICIPFYEAMCTTIGIVRLKNVTIPHQADMLYQYFMEHGLSPVSKEPN